MDRAEVYTGLALVVLGIIFTGSLVFGIIFIMLIVGVLLLFHGFGVLWDTPGKAKAGSARFGPLDRTILEMVSQGKSQDEIARVSGVSPQLVAEKAGALAAEGYIKDNYLTEKGFEAVRSMK